MKHLRFLKPDRIVAAVMKVLFPPPTPDLTAEVACGSYNTRFTPMRSRKVAGGRVDNTFVDVIAGAVRGPFTKEEWDDLWCDMNNCGKYRQPPTAKAALAVIKAEGDEGCSAAVDAIKAIL